jgi:phosphopantothenate synthetase
VKNPFSTLNNKIKSAIRDKAIDRAKTRIVLMQKKPEEFSPEELEVIVHEEESKIYSAIKEKGLLAILAVLGLNFFG